MDETFAFIAPVMPRRTVNPMALRAAVIATVFVAVSGALGLYVVQHEQAADARREALATEVAAAEDARIAEVAAQEDAPVGIDGAVDTAAEDAAEEALGYAQAALAADGSFASAGPGTLATLGSALVFVDGPSTAPTIASIASGDDLWAVAVASSSGCVWLSLTSDGDVARDTGRECTGAAALDAIGDAW
jgi:hypothetical protein